MKLIGIAGGTSSGKTTLLKGLQEKLGGQIATLSFDDYFIGSDLYDLDEITDFEDPKLYNWPKFLEDLRQLKAGKSIIIRANSRESSQGGIKEKTIQAKPMVVVEGWLIFHNPEPAALFDKKIFIEIPENEIILRRHARSQGTTHWDSSEYINSRILPGHHKYVAPQKTVADLVLDGLKPPEELASQVTTFIKFET